MRLTYVYDEHLPSTATDTEQVNNTAAALARLGVDVELIVPRRAKTEPVTPERLANYYQLEGAFRVRQVPASLSSVRPLEKVMHAWRGVAAVGPTELVYTRNLPILQAALRARHRVIFEHYRPWPDQHPPLEPWLRAMLRHPLLLGVVCHSQHAEQSYARIGVPAEKLVTIHNGYDPRRMLPRLERAEARRLLELPDRRPLVVYTGRVNAKKGLMAVLALAERLPDVGFVLVGSEGVGEVERRAAALSNVVVKPWQPFDLTVKYLYAADALIIPPTLSPLEQHGNTVLPMKLFQYLASGRPVVAPRAPDTAELLHHDENAVLVPADRLEEQVAELVDLLGSTERWHRVVAGALRDSAELTWDARARRLVTFIEERLRASPREPSSDDWSGRAWLGRTARYLTGQFR